MRIAHCSDTHLDGSAAVGGRIVLGPDGVNIRWKDRMRCFRAAAEAAIERGCHLFIHAGDLFERNKPTPAEYCAAEEVLGLICNRMPCILIADNHGQVESVTERHAVEPLTGYHSNLFVSVRPEMLAIVTPAGSVQVATLPSPRRSIVAAKDEFRGLSPQEINTLISDKLRAIIQGFRARLDPRRPAILVFHGKVLGAWLTEMQQATGTDQVALTPEDFADWEYVALGDFHGMQQVAPNAWYSGATDRTSFNEEHQAKGWLSVEIDGPGAMPRVDFIETPARRFVTLTPDELVHSEPLPEIVYRVKSRVTQEEYDQLGPALARWRACPLFSEALEVVRETRARNEAMTGELTVEAALTQWANSSGKTEILPALLTAHREIAGIEK